MTFTERIYTAPTLAAISLPEAKAHLRITDSETADDTYITSLISVATMLAEGHTNRALLTQTWDLWVNARYSDSWLSGFRTCWHRGVIQLPRGPVQSIDLVEALAEDGTSTTLTEGLDYVTDLLGEEASICIKSSVSAHKIHIRYTAGEVSADAIPAPIKQAILLQISDLYDNRTNEVVGASSSIILTASGVEALLRNYRLFPLGVA